MAFALTPGCSRRKVTVSSWPIRAALMSGVLPTWSLTFGSNLPLLNKIRSSRVAPKWARKCRTVYVLCGKLFGAKKARPSLRRRPCWSIWKWGESFMDIPLFQWGLVYGRSRPESSFHKPAKQSIPTRTASSESPWKERTSTWLQTLRKCSSAGDKWSLSIGIFGLRAPGILVSLEAGCGIHPSISVRRSVVNGSPNSEPKGTSLILPAADVLDSTTVRALETKILADCKQSSKLWTYSLLAVWRSWTVKPASCKICGFSDSTIGWLDSLLFGGAAFSLVVRPSFCFCSDWISSLILSNLQLIMVAVSSLVELLCNCRQL